MPSPLDPSRPSLPPPARALAERLRQEAPSWLWRGLHPLVREPFAESAGLRPLDVVDVRTADGWSLPVRHVPARGGGSGAPVVLLHTLGLGPDSFRYGREGTFADLLTAAGLGVYLPVWRTDSEATPPEGGGRAGFEEVAHLDLPAIMAAVCRHAGARRVLVVGHGLGGLAALAWLARAGDERLAGMVALGVPVRFPWVSSSARLGAWVASRVAGGVRLPARELLRAAAVLVPPDRQGRVGQPGRGPRWRGALVHAAEDVPVGLLGELGAWCAAGALVDRTGTLDYGLALASVRAPLLLGAGAGDTWCPPERVLPLAELWTGGPVTCLDVPDGLGHLDLLLDPAGARRTHQQIATWLTGQAEATWCRARQGAA